MRQFASDFRRWGLGTAVWNARFNLGYRLGGFKRASR
jgi:hypothetical protein